MMTLCSSSLTVQDKQGTHEKLSQNKTKQNKTNKKNKKIKTTSVDHSGNNTVLRIKAM